MAIRFWEFYKETHETYRLTLLAGKNGMDNVVGWVHMLEDETIINRFTGQELAVTTCMKAQEDKDWLLHLVTAMKKADSTGIIINIGMYLTEVPEDVIRWCEEQDFPLLVMPWEISCTSVIQDFCMRIMRRAQRDKELGTMFQDIMRGQELSEDSLTRIRTRFDVSGTFRIFCIRISLGVEDTTAFHQSILKLENLFGIWQNGKKIQIPYLLIECEDCYALTVNNYPDASPADLTGQILDQFTYFTEKKLLSLGVGPEVRGIQNLKTAFRRAQIAVKMAFQTKQKVINFNEMGFFKILFSCDDTAILQNYQLQMLGVLEEHDRRHHSDLLSTLRSYIENDRSLIGVANATFTHRNTVNYRVQKIKKLLDNELKTAEDLFPYQVAFYIKDMNL
ncbi:MAG: PucR family transcriptional regulator [Lachnospiraceae bacterium]|nr:PucR family transcriptional regulator [Lachnospiraceae bacterium]